MFETSELSATLRMISEEHLDMRTVTIGIILNDCASRNGGTFCGRNRSQFH